MNFDPKPGKANLNIVPDLAAEAPKVSDDGLTWTFKLRSGLKYDDGSPIVAKDVKYGVLRSNWGKDVLPNGPNYFAQFLDAPKDYKGPYKDKNIDDVKFIETPDDTTIIFHLKKPFADFGYLATSPQAAPVPQAKDPGAEYKLHIVSSGSYKVDSYEPGKQMTLSPNPNWDPASDPLRKQTASKIEVGLKVEANDLDNRLMAGSLDIDIAGVGVQVPSQAKIFSDPTLKANSDNVIAGFLRMMAINQHVKPFDNVHCRKAVQWAVDKTTFQNANGGPITGGAAPTTVLPPTVAGYQKFDLYPSADGKGDVAKAKEELAACGQPNGFKTKVSARADRPKEVATAEAIQQALKRVGIDVEIKTFPSGKYFSNFAGVPNYVHENGLGLILSAWAADWPTGMGFLQQISDGRAIAAAGNSNWAEIDDPAINKMFDDAAKNNDQAAREALYAAIDKKIVEDAYLVPGIYAKALLYRSPNTTNVNFSPAYGMYDYLNMGAK
jgi:peptide/nickel transport system substrate-binding protein